MKMKSKLPLVIALSTLALSSLPLMADDHHCPMHGKHMSGHRKDGVVERGDEVMGFAAEKTTHHFLLSKVGGAIEVTADNPADSDSIGHIRAHLKEIAIRFGEGDFAQPHEIHAMVPPGVATMKRLGSDIEYTYEDLESGGTLRIASGRPEAIHAIHEFLRFQIEEHDTGDPVEVSER